MNAPAGPPQAARRHFLQGLGLGASTCWLPAWAQPAATEATAPPLPVAQFFQRPAFSGAELSPNGQRVALRVGAVGQRDRLAVLDTTTMQLQLVAAYKDADVRRFRWVNDQRLVYDLADFQVAAADTAFAPGLFAVNADGSGLRSLVHREYVAHRYDDHRRELPWNTFLLGQTGPQNSDHVFVVQPDAVTDKGFDYYRLLKLNTVSGLAEELDAPKQAFQWLLDANGELRAVFTAREQRAAIHWRNPADGRWRQIREFERYGTDAEFTMHAVAPDGRLYVTARPGTDTQGVYLFNPATDQLEQPAVLALPQFDIDPEFIERNQRLLGLRHTLDARVTQWFDDTLRQQQAEIDRRLPATANLLTPPRRGDSPNLLVRAFADVQPDLYLLYNSSTRKLVRLGTEQPHIVPARMARTDFVRYPARDGLEIPAYLTLPAGAKAGSPPPLVVMVHGGPWVRGAEWEWQPEVQFLASRGYAVLQPEFRGSTGFGLKHFTAGWRQWGRAMQDDLADGVRWAAAAGHADPQRVAVLGASYGGYAALMGTVRHPELYRCAASHVGVTDLQLMFSTARSDLTHQARRYTMPQLVGDPVADAEMLRRHSPVARVADIKVPVLLAHGSLDRRVPREHANRFEAAARRAGVAIERVDYAEEGHGFMNPENHADYLTRLDAFIARAIGRAD